MRRKRFVVDVGAIVGVRGHKTLYLVLEKEIASTQTAWRLQAIGNGRKTWFGEGMVVAPTEEQIHAEKRELFVRDKRARARCQELQVELTALIGGGHYAD
jgi:hypothetical protein